MSAALFNAGVNATGSHAVSLDGLAFVAYQRAADIAPSSSPYHGGAVSTTKMPTNQHTQREYNSIRMLMPLQGTHAASRSGLFRNKVASRGPFSADRLRQKSPVGSGLISQLMRWRGKSQAHSNRESSSTALNMVLTTPESIIEKASTQNLLDDLLDESVRTSARKPIMMQFNPSRKWIWKQWRGTVFSETWRSCLRNMSIAVVIALIYRYERGIMEQLGGFNILWGQLLSVTTFTLTFFLNQSYALWRKCYELSRRLQGRLNDLGLTMAAHAARTTPMDPNDPSEYTPPARQTLQLMSRYIRVFNLLTYASFTRSHRPILTPRGMRRLVERGLITPLERQILVDTEVPATQRHNAVLIWIIRVFIEGRQAGHFVGGAGFEQQFMEKIHITRAQYGAIADELQGRMPLAYAHIVQVLVDVILWMYPFMAFSSGMTPLLGVLGTGLLTIFYQGLFDLAKQFLDPYDNENYGKGDDPLCVDTLIAETNSGSIRWMNSFAQQPFSSQRLRDGELYDNILSIRGISVAEILEMEEQEEAERQKKEKEKEEERLRKEKEHAEWLKKEEEDEYSELLKYEIENVTQLMVDHREIKKSEQAIVEDVSTEPITNLVGEDLKELYEQKIMANTDESDEKNIVHTVLSFESGEPDVSLDDTIKLEPNAMPRPELKLSKNFDEFAESASSEVEEFENDLDTSKVEVESRRTITVKAEAVNRDIGLTESTKKKKDDLSLSDGKTIIPTGNDVDDDLPDEYKTRDYTDMFQTLDWFDELGPDGQEYRLSEMLADEEWKEELEREATKYDQKPLTYEDYSKKAADIFEAAENELLETEAILNFSPGLQSDPDGKDSVSKKSDGTTVRPMRKFPTEKEAVTQNQSYDQTRLDSISQLWGAPPGVLDLPASTDSMNNLRYEDYRFDGISQLWGGSLGGSESSPPLEEPKDAEDTSFTGISQLWGGSVENSIEDGDSLNKKMKSDSSVMTTERSNSDSRSGQKVSTSFSGSGLWFEEIGADGKEFRLSEMLADELWEEEMEPEIAAPMTLEEYSKQATEIREKAEDEFLETEAILKAPPGASTIDVDNLEEVTVDRNNKLTASSETAAVAEAVMELAEKEAEKAEGIIENRPAIDDDVLDVLDMDMKKCEDDESLEQLIW